MSGTQAGGKAAAATNKKRNPNFYREIGKMGGKKGTTGGFWHTKHVLKAEDKIRAWGRKGGTKSRRTVK